MEKPDSALAFLAIKQFKETYHINGMKKVFEEDVNIHSKHGAVAALSLASQTGMWEKCLELVQSNVALRKSPAGRAALVNVLCSQRQWELALQSLSLQPRMELSPSLVRPIVRELGTLGKPEAAVQLLSASSASGFSMNSNLFATTIGILRLLKQWENALLMIQEMNLFSVPRSEAQRSASLYHHATGCLYDFDYYADYTVAEVVEEITSRMNPKEFYFRLLSPKKQFRLVTHSEAYAKFHHVIFPLQNVLFKIAGIPQFYTKPLSLLAEEAHQRRAVIHVYDTNFLLQYVSKNLSFHHFRPHIEQKLPLTAQYSSCITVIPLTVVMEAHHLIWNHRSRLRHSVKLLMWSRLLALARHPDVRVLSLSCDYPASSLSMISRMAYAKLNISDFERDPDLRILNVCLSLHHGLRAKRVAESQGTQPPDGVMLFAFLKYHVRRYANTVKGSACDQLVLCTLDSRLSRAAEEAGVCCFPLSQSS